MFLKICILIVASKVTVELVKEVAKLTSGLIGQKEAGDPGYYCQKFPKDHGFTYVI